MSATIACWFPQELVLTWVDETGLLLLLMTVAELVSETLLLSLFWTATEVVDVEPSLLSVAMVVVMMGGGEFDLGNIEDGAKQLAS